MHTNFHFAVGIIIASLVNLKYPLDFWSFGFIVCCAFAMDFDIILKNKFKDSNHRLSPLHSIYPILILLIIGLILDNKIIIFGSMAYFSHISFDMIDWGVNLFYFNHKLVGLFTQWDKADRREIGDILKEYKCPSFFFNQLYYTSSLMLSMEFIIGISMCFVLFYTAIYYWYYIFGYLILLLFHMYDYFESRRQNMGKPARTKLFREP